MTTDFRALCAELLDWAEATAAHYIQLPAVMLRARAALADEPAVPQGREPASVTGQPVDGEVAELVETLKGIAYWRRHGKPGEPAPTSFDIRQADQLDRTAELLERLSPPQPVAVSERPWEREGWCDIDGLCWLGSDALGNCTPTWLYGPPAWAERFPIVHRVLLPAHALPLPEVGE